MAVDNDFDVGYISEAGRPTQSEPFDGLILRKIFAPQRHVLNIAPSCDAVCAPNEPQQLLALRELVDIWSFLDGSDACEQTS